MRMVPAVALSAVVLASCGSTQGKSADAPRPPSPVALSVYINDSHVSVSPKSVGAGPIQFIVANQASRSEALAITDGSHTLASTAPINPQGTTQVTVDVKPGTYTVGVGPRGSTDAQRSQPSSIAGASIHVGRPRASSSNQVLQP